MLGVLSSDGGGCGLDLQCLELVLDLVHHDLLRIGLDEGSTADKLKLGQNLEEARVLVVSACPDLLEVTIDHIGRCSVGKSESCWGLAVVKDFP